MNKVDKIIEDKKLFIRLNKISEILKENTIIISDNLLYKSQIGKGCLFPFYYIKENKNIQIFLVIENSRCYFNTRYKNVNLYLKKRDEKYLNELIIFLIEIGKSKGLDNVVNPIKKGKKNKLIKVKYFEKNEKLNTKIIDEEYKIQLENLNGYKLCEGSFVIRITGIFKGNLGEHIIFHLMEASITQKPIYIKTDEMKLKEITRQRIRKNLTDKEMKKIINKKGITYNNIKKEQINENFNLPL